MTWLVFLFYFHFSKWQNLIYYAIFIKDFLVFSIDILNYLNIRHQN